MTAMDDYLDSPLDVEDVFPCKGCGEILEEGKAFELAGNRWHLDCFRCNTCNTLLDSDANLLLLGDGSLICNNCTYSCSACGNKIEDLAILTGDQAFCATCFRCRNCKRKIENLRYARTSQGIFCMSCHESLMARRRKKAKAAAQTKARDKDGSPVVIDKSLPALPPNAVPPNNSSNDRETPESDTPTELSPRPRPAYTSNDSSSRGSSRPARSPERPSETTRDSALVPPMPSYRNNRNSSIISGDINIGVGNDGDTFFIPVALDPSPALSAGPRSVQDWKPDTGKKTKEAKDYSAGLGPSTTAESTMNPPLSTPHIAFQEKGRHASSSEQESPQAERPTRKLSKKQGQAKLAPAASTYDRRPAYGHTRMSSDEFKLQDAPKSKKLTEHANVPPEVVDDGHLPRKSNNGYAGKERGISAPSSSTLGPADRHETPRNSQEDRFRDEESLQTSSGFMNPDRSEANRLNTIARKELPPSASRSVNGKIVSEPSARSGISDSLTTSSMTSSRPALPEQKSSDVQIQPGVPPQPAVHSSRGSLASATDPPSPKASPKLPRWSAGGDFSMDEDMARILGTDEGSSSILRRVSNAVRHGRNSSSESATHHGRIGHTRSVSESTRLTASPHWPRTPIAEDPPDGARGYDISSPIPLTSEAQNDADFLKRQLRNSEQRVAELERQFSTEKDLKNLNKRLLEKRKTVSVLDTQTEIMIRQLEVLAGYVERAKESKQPMDTRELEESAIKDFIQKLDKVKQSMAATIERLLAERDEAVEGKKQAIADRDRAALEFEQLSSKNAQLADLNNDLTHQIQERFKSHSDTKSPNGLGIYSHAKGVSSASIPLDSASFQTGVTLIHTDTEEPVLEGPTVVNIRKGQVRKFNWKKGGSKVAQNISKGINRAAVAFQQQEQQRPQQGLAGDSIGLPYNMTSANVDSPVSYGPTGPVGQRQPIEIASGKSFAFFTTKRPVKSASVPNVSTPSIAEAPTTLFGSDLVERAEYERRHIPNVVTRCIEEVELRGMDMEGIYRKTGGNSQIKLLQEGFDRNEDFDISDPGIDITAVTSVLKQYFRKLPIPLVTFDVYEHVLDSNTVLNDTERCAHLRKTVNLLPQKHRDCLEFLVFHLARVASNERENLMSPKNLAVVFAPTIMRDHSLEKEMTDMHAKNMAVQFIIEHSQAIFNA